MTEFTKAAKEGQHDERQSAGTLHDTYHAALQYGHDKPDDDDLVLGVVAKEMYGIQTHIDENVPVLAPPLAALEEFKELADEIGHNEAVDELLFDERYREHIRTDDEVREAMGWVLDQLETGRDVWLVCYENTDDKFCHRCILKEELRKVHTATDQEVSTNV